MMGGMRRATLVASFLAAGCVSVLPEAGPAPQIYRLDGEGGGPPATALSTVPGALSELTVLVPEPLAPRALATDRLAVIMEGEHISYASGARWNERAPKVVQERILSAFEDDARVRAAVRPEDGVQSSYELRLEMRSFEAVYRDGEKSAPTAVVSLRAKLVDRTTRDLVASARIDTEQLAAANRMGEIVEAFDRALDDAGREVVTWTVEQSAANGRSSGPLSQLSARAAGSGG